MSKITVAQEFGCLLYHGMILDLHGKRVKVHHPLWRRVLHVMSFRRFPLHSGTEVTVTDL